MHFFFFYLRATAREKLFSLPLIYCSWTPFGSQQWYREKELKVIITRYFFSSASGVHTITAELRYKRLSKDFRLALHPSSRAFLYPIVPFPRRKRHLRLFSIAGSAGGAAAGISIRTLWSWSGKEGGKRLELPRISEGYTRRIEAKYGGVYMGGSSCWHNFQSARIERWRRWEKENTRVSLFAPRWKIVRGYILFRKCQGWKFLAETTVIKNS